ncbi:MAG TPA: type II toxin-antitoxin system RelE/ParE family toxin [Thermoanaerobaculia bacterium]
MYSLELTESALEDLRFLKKLEQRYILDMAERYLSVEPQRPALNRKPLRPNDLSAWELRIREFRVFYDVDAESRIVLIKAVGWKERNRLLIQGKEYSL